jgi:hypothetical protein
MPEGWRGSAWVTRDEAFSDAARQRQSHDDGAVPAAEVALLADPDIDRAQVQMSGQRLCLSA